MKSNLHIVLLLLLPTLLFSQTSNDEATYLDSLHNIGTEQNYKYIRIVKDYKILDKEQYQVNDYYKSGKMEMAGATATRIYLTRTGTFVYFYENGNRKSITNYKLDKPYGFYYEFYENGNKRLEGEWTDDDKTVIPKLKIKNYWDSNTIQTIKEGNGNYEEIYTDGFKGFSKGKIKNNMKDSIWIGEYKKPHFSFKENYKNGKFISGVSIDSAKVEHKYEIAEVRPVPKKGMDHFYRYISRAMRIPEAARNTVFGKIYLTFVIEKDGSIVDIKIIRGLGYGLDEEVIRVIKNYKEWLPGIRRGIPVRTLYSIPITIAK